MTKERKAQSQISVRGGNEKMNIGEIWYGQWLNDKNAIVQSRLIYTDKHS